LKSPKRPMHIAVSIRSCKK